MSNVIRLVKETKNENLKIMGFAFLAAVTVLKEARYGFRDCGGLVLLAEVFGGQEGREEVERYAAQMVTAMAEWPIARAEMAGLRAALESRKSRGYVFERAANQLAWSP
jgi:hypothetical protein